MTEVSSRLREFNVALRTFEQFVASPEYLVPTQRYQSQCDTINQAFSQLGFLPLYLRNHQVEAWVQYESTYVKRMRLEREVATKRDRLQRAIARLHGYNIPSP